MDCIAAGQVLHSHTLVETIEIARGSFICMIVKHNA